MDDVSDVGGWGGVDGVGDGVQRSDHGPLAGFTEIGRAHV